MNQSKMHVKQSMTQKYLLTLIYPPHFEDVQCQSGVNYIYEG